MSNVVQVGDIEPTGKFEAEPLSTPRYKAGAL